MKEAYFVNDHKYMIDLFSGLGGASEAFVNDNEWMVHRFDNNPLLEEIEYTQITDNMFLDAEELCVFLGNAYGKQIDLLWASPPCTEFSHGFNSPVSKMRRGEEGFENFIPSLGLVKQTITTIQNIKPKYWVIENVKGAIEEFNDIIGQHWSQRIGAFYLWGNFPMLAFQDRSDTEHKKLDAKGSRLLRPNYRALVPYPVSMALLNSFEHQQSLKQWC